MHLLHSLEKIIEARHTGLKPSGAKRERAMPAEFKVMQAHAP